MLPAAPARTGSTNTFRRRGSASIAIGVDVEIDLTPGVSVAPEVLTWVDTNGDGRISDSRG